MSSRKRDSVYQTPLDQLVDFEFNQQVVSVFEDMINRSVPGYGTIVRSISDFAALFAQDNSHCYDLGCSLGASAIAMQAGLHNKQQVNIIAVDQSAEMIERATVFVAKAAKKPPIKLQQADVLNISISDASLVTLNFTLQFIPLEQRQGLLNTIYQGMKPGGCLVMSEKIRFKNTSTQDTITTLHHRFKAAQGYSELEIAQKRDALENVMRLDTQQQHIDRLQTAGFEVVQQWYQNTAFVSFYAIK